MWAMNFLPSLAALPWRQRLQPVLSLAQVLVLSLLAHGPALSQVGLRQFAVPGGGDEAAATPVALYYPSDVRSQVMALGPFEVRGQWQAAPAERLKGLILLSHGTGGSERGHSRLAESLAAQGYLVAALRHPGDNWADRSLRDGPEAGDYFHRRPRQVSRVLDALLADPDWQRRLPSDAAGPRVAALGHSAGGYTVLALAGGQPEPGRLVQHCARDGERDPIFCSMVRQVRAEPATAAPQPRVADPRIRAVAALAPLGAVFEPGSLARITVPTLIVEAGADRFLVPAFHSGWVAQHLRGAQRVRVDAAWHFVFMDTPRMPLPSPDGDVGANPPGFDREAFLSDLGQQLGAFFDGALR